VTCPRCGLRGASSPGEGHLCFHPKTNEQYADAINRRWREIEEQEHRECVAKMKQGD